MPKLNAIGTPAKMQMPTITTKKTTRFPVADVVEQRLPEPQAKANEQAACGCYQQFGQGYAGEQLAQRGVEQQRQRDHLAGYLPTAGNLQCRRQDCLLLDGEGDAGHQNADGEQGHDHRRNACEIAAQLWTETGDEERHPHMLTPAQRDHGTQADQPQKQDGGQFAGPDQRQVQHVAPHYAGEQDHDLDHDERRGQGTRPPDRSAGRAVSGRRPAEQNTPAVRQPSGPVTFSRAAQSAGSNFAFQSL